MANSPLPFTGGVGGGPVYLTDLFDKPSANLSREREGNK
jgi:hypothetical protein